MSRGIFSQFSTFIFTPRMFIAFAVLQLPSRCFITHNKWNLLNWVRTKLEFWLVGYTMPCVEGLDCLTAVKCVQDLVLSVLTAVDCWVERTSWLLLYNSLMTSPAWTVFVFLRTDSIPAAVSLVSPLVFLMIRYRSRGDLRQRKEILNTINQLLTTYCIEICVLYDNNYYRRCCLGLCVL